MKKKFRPAIKSVDLGPRNFDQRKALVIDDDPLILEIVRAALQHASFLVETATTMDRALMDQYLKFKPNIIVLDVMLGDQNGLDFIQMIQSLPNDQRCPVILLTSKKTPDDILNGIAAGAIDYFVKPPDLEKLVERCDRLTAQKKFILVADDDSLFTEMIQFELRQSGFNSKSVADGNLVLNTAIQCQPDLILLDRMMPGTEGLTIVNDLKGHADTRHIPIIIVSSKRNESDIVEALKLEIEDYITKPIRPQELVMRVVRCLKH